MSKRLSCHYCGRPNASQQRPGEPFTCRGCRHLLEAERELEAELERQLERYYNGEQSARS